MSLSPWLSLLLCMLIACHGSQAAVFTLDLGSESLKVAVVNPKPGQAPISIAINEISKRKSPALVALTASGDRFLSEEASNLLGRFPDQVFARARDVAGLHADEATRLLGESLLASYNTSRDPARGTLVFQSLFNGTSVGYSPQELLAMLLEYAQSLATSHAGEPVRDAVVTVPAFFGQSQRQALLDAGAVAGLNVMALIQEPAGVALQYGISRDFSADAPSHVLVYDMGATSVYAAVLQFSSYGTKERGKNVTVNQFQVRSVRWDADLGGQSFEAVLLHHFAEEFNAKTGLPAGFDVRRFPKSLAKLKKAVKRTKEVLSANTESSIRVESLYEEMDMSSSITRQKFEELSSDLLLRAILPLSSALKDANLTVQELDAVELVGGATRMPGLQTALLSALAASSSAYAEGGNRTLDRHLDADEALALGSSLFAANMSDGFKLNRRLGMIDGLPYGIGYRISFADSKEGGETGEALGVTTLFPCTKKFPIKLIKSLKDARKPTAEGAAGNRATTPLRDFVLSMLYQGEEGSPLPPRHHPVEAPLAEYNVTGGADVEARYASHNLTHPPRISLHFALSRSGIASLERAEVVVDYSEWVNETSEVEAEETEEERLQRVNEAKEKEGAGEEPDSSGNNNEGSEQKEEKVKGKGAADGGSDADAKANATAGTVGNGTAAGNGTLIEEGPRMVKRNVTVTRLQKRTVRVPLQINILTAPHLRALSDAEILSGRNKLKALREVEEKKRALAAAKNDLESYIYSTKDKLEYNEETGSVTTPEQREELRGKLEEAEEWLYAEGDEEMSLQPFKSKLADLKVLGDQISFRVSELTARPEAVRTARTFIADAIELLRSWEEKKPWINATKIEDLLSQLTNLTTWLDDKETAQASLSPHEDAAFSSWDAQDKVAVLSAKIKALGRTPKPQPEKKKAKNLPESDKNSTTSGEGADAEGPSSSSKGGGGGNNTEAKGTTKDGSSQTDSPAGDGKDHDEL